ncbi:AAA family ATPase with putative Homeodomain-like domain [Bifidobacterium coryneforme]|nr:AAA family ATPase with putative Homeodomain-like domain [Bifidobacterium coryneforme]
MVQLSRLGLENKQDDLRMYLTRLIKRYRHTQPEFSNQLSQLLHTSSPTQRVIPPREFPNYSSMAIQDASSNEKPHLNSVIESQLNEIIVERKQAKELLKVGLSPVSSAIFTGAPGVGKTMAAKWLAHELNFPLYRLDLVASVSSKLGETGINLQTVFRQASAEPSILFLDEIDAVAKTRSDVHDIGEMKRLVTVLLQLLDMWNPQGIVLAATNNPELIDPAVWRRFELKVDFPMPTQKDLYETLKADTALWKNSMNDTYLEMLCIVLSGKSYSEARLSLSSIRKQSIITGKSMEMAIVDYVSAHVASMSHRNRIQLATKLAVGTDLSQRAIAAATGVSKETIRKYRNQSKSEEEGR